MYDSHTLGSYTEVKKSMKEKGIASELIKENKVDMLQTYVMENYLNLVMQKFRYQQNQ